MASPWLFRNDVNGSLESLVKLISKDAKAAKRFAQAAEKARENEKSRPTAEFLMALFKIQQGLDRDVSVRKLRELVQKQEGDTPDDEVSEASAPAISGGLLWQSAQILAQIDGIDQRSALLIAIYEKSVGHATLFNNSFQYSVAPRLVDAYVENDQLGKARRFLLDTYAGVDHSQLNQHNPGYGDSQDLNDFKGIADKMVAIGLPIDAMAVYRRAIAEPGKFEVAKRWGGSGSVTEFEKAATAAVKKVTPKNSIVYLDQMGTGLAQSDRKPLIDLMDLPLDSLGDDDWKPGLWMAIESAQKTEAGRDALGRFADQLSRRTTQVNSDWSLPATQILVATQTDPSKVPNFAKTLMSQLPSTETIAANPVKVGLGKHRELLDLFTPAAACLQCKDKQAQGVGRELAAYLESLSKALGEPRLQLALSRLSGDQADSFDAYLRSIEAKVNPGSPLSKDQVNQVLKIAKTTARSGDVLLSTRALTLALSNGPPLRQMNSSQDAFSIAKPSNGRQQRHDGGMGNLVRQVNEIVDLYSDAIGHKLGVRELDSPKGDPASKKGNQAIRPQDTEQAVKAIADALQSIVFPEQRMGEVFPYAKETVSTTPSSFFRPASEIVPESLSRALARAASLAEQSGPLIDFIRSRVEKTNSKVDVASVLLDVAVAAHDPKAVLEAIELFSIEVDSMLPKLDAKILATSPTRVITQQMQQDSFRKSETINLVLRTVWPLTLNMKSYPPEVRNRVIELLERTRNLIASDRYTSMRLNAIAKLISQRVLQVIGKNDPHRFHRILNIEINAVKMLYVNSSTSDDQRSASEKRALEGLLGQLISQGHISQMPNFARNLIGKDRGRSLDLQSMTAASICLEVAKLPQQQQFEFLKQVTLGDDDQAALGFWGGFVRFTTPPPLVQRQTPNLIEIQSLPLCDPDVPVTDTILLLADVAVKLGKSNEVAEAIAGRSTQLGDDADVAAGLVRLTAAMSDSSPRSPQEVIESLAPTYAAIAEDLAANQPTETDSKLRYPLLSTYLVTRSIRAGLPQQRSVELIQALRTYATRGNRNMMVSALGRVIARLGVGRAANATPSSPLEHFASIPLRHRYAPDLASLSTLYTFDEHGFVRGTSGNSISMLMLRYPVVGSFAVTADIWDDGWGESELAYGGVLYQLSGWNKTAAITTVNGKSVDFPVPSIRKGEMNSVGLRVDADEIVGLCNNVSYVTDIKTDGYPWIAISKRMYQTTRFGNLKIIGDARIPRQVNMLDPTMRGWGFLASGNTLPDPLLPIGPKQDAKKIAAQRGLAKKNDEARWRVIDGKLKFAWKADTDPSPLGGIAFVNAQPSHIEYLRPLLEGESTELSFWWEWDAIELYPSIGRTVLQFGRKGMTPSWVTHPNDLTRLSYVVAEELDPPSELLGKDNVPIDQSWNTIKMTRKDNTIEVFLNDKSLVHIPVTHPPRPGLMRPKDREVRVREMTLTGDWPDKIPTDLMLPSQTQDTSQR